MIPNEEIPNEVARADANPIGRVIVELGARLLRPLQCWLGWCGGIINHDGAVYWQCSRWAGGGGSNMVRTDCVGRKVTLGRE